MLSRIVDIVSCTVPERIQPFQQFVAEGTIEGVGHLGDVLH
jgi:hypothetical protein